MRRWGIVIGMPDLSRRIFLGALAGAALPAGAVCPADPRTVCNLSELHSVTTAGVQVVRDADDVRQALLRWPGKVSVGGGRYSMGGQTALAGGLQLDMRGADGLVAFDAAARTVRVQAGMRWRALQALIDPWGLAVRTMQSYANFTVGGSVSVNCHGRYVGHGAIAASVRALQLVLPDGSIVETSRTRVPDLFRAAIGGYGAVGVITEVELALDENLRIERSAQSVALDDYPAWFASQVLADPAALLHNADLLPPDFTQPQAITWRRSQAALTETGRLRPVGGSHLVDRAVLWALTELDVGPALRRHVVQPWRDRPAVVWRNHEASRDVAELEPAQRDTSTYVLQEYFVPPARLVPFVRAMAPLLAPRPTHTTVNVSIRHAPADPDSLMAWTGAEGEGVFCCVLYVKQRTTAAAQQAVAAWTRALVALALAHGGRHYLPYQPHASQAQFEAAYPQAVALRRLRCEIGAQRLSNSLWQGYGV